MAPFYLGFVLFSIVCGVLLGHAGQLTAALIQGAGQGVELVITLAGPVSLWCGLSKLLEATGWSEKLADWLSPLLGRLFPEGWRDSKTRAAISGNFSANLLGLGNAATPLGVQAAVRLSGGAERASDELCRLVVLNTASVQLIPATVAGLRAGLGCATPLDILPAVWVSSVVSVVAGLTAAKVLSRWVR